MNRDKQIEEIAKIIGSRAKVEVWSPLKTDEQLAEEIYNAGYRKTSDIAREIFEEIEEEITAALKSNYKVLPQLEFSNELYNRVQGKVDALRGVEGFVAELKKKYTESSNEIKEGVK